jgi:hypothetical protein
VYSGEHYHQQTVGEREVPGPFYFPPVASLITAGGRLLLTLAQACVENAGGTYLFCDTDSLCVVADEKGGFARGGARADLGYVEGADPREFAPVPCLPRDTVIKISERFASLNPYSFGGTILKVEDVNYVDGDLRKPFRDLHGYAISAKRYSLFEGKNVRKIVDSKAHGIGYLMTPIQRKVDRDEDQFATAFWQCVLHNEGISHQHEDPEWLDLPAMMRIPVSSPAVLGRLKDFCKPYDFVLAPVVRDGDFNLDEEANKPILVTRFSKTVKNGPRLHISTFAPASHAESRPENRQARGPLPCGLTVQFSTPTSTMPNRNSMDPTESNVAAGRVACSRECMLRLANTDIVAKNSSGNSNRVRWITTSSSSARSTKMGGLWPDLRLCASWPTSPSVKLEKEPAYVATPSG